MADTNEALARLAAERAEQRAAMRQAAKERQAAMNARAGSLEELRALVKAVAR